MSLASGSDRASRSSLVTTNVSPGPAGASAGADRDGRSIAPLTVIDKDVQAKRAIRADTVFRIGEVSKQLTATAVLVLAQDGQLALDDRLSHHLEGLPDWAERVTLSQLMHHDSGIRDVYESLPKNTDPEKPMSRTAVRARYERLRDLDFEPGTRWNYSNTNYLLLADVVERRSGKPFQSFLEERIHRRKAADHRLGREGSRRSGDRVRTRRRRETAAVRIPDRRHRRRRTTDLANRTRPLGGGLPHRYGRRARLIAGPVRGRGLDHARRLEPDVGFRGLRRRDLTHRGQHPRPHRSCRRVVPVGVRGLGRPDNCGSGRLQPSAISTLAWLGASLRSLSHRLTGVRSALAENSSATLHCSCVWSMRCSHRWSRVR
jgi:hypothetical protein